MTTRASPHLFGPRADLAVFLGPTLVGLLVFALGPKPHALLGPKRDVPDWAFFALVVAVDVAHVWSTLFRTYLDPEEIRRRRALYTLVPAAVFALGLGTYAIVGDGFWRILAYVAVFHFVRQQAGWVAIFRAKSGPNDRVDAWVDAFAVYASTLAPLFVWHTDPDRPFSWFLAGDFVFAPALAPLRPLAAGVFGASLVAFGARQIVRARRGLPISRGKIAVVLSTAASWWVGIVVASDDLSFTALNVLPHGVPYVVLLFAYAKERAKEAPGLPGSKLVALGALPFVLLLVAIALGEEAAWDRLVWHDRAALFGWLPAIEGLPKLVLVPLLTVPQATHYVLDAVLWRRRDTGAAQAAALGFGS